MAIESPSRRSALTRLCAAAAGLTVGATRAGLTSPSPPERCGLQYVASIWGDQPAGIVRTASGRMFITFPRHDGLRVHFTLGELRDGRVKPYPDARWNLPDILHPDRSFFSVQNVQSDGQSRLWMLDTGVLQVGMPPLPGAPKLVIVDIESDRVEEVIPIPDAALVRNSALKDFRISPRTGNAKTVFITDSAPGAEALIVFDLASRRGARRLSGTRFVRPPAGMVTVVEGEPLTVLTAPGQTSPFAVGLNGVELSNDGLTLYFNAFTGRRLFSVSALAAADGKVTGEVLAEMVVDHGPIGIAGHLAIDAAGRLYAMNMEKNAIWCYPMSGECTTIAFDSQLIWPDTMSIAPDRYLYVTSSQHDRRPQFHGGRDMRRPPFQIFRVYVGAGPAQVPSSVVSRAD